MSRKKERISTEGGQPLANNPFASLNLDGLPKGPEELPLEKSQPSPPAKKNRGRVDIVRQTAHRGGKTVTVVSGFHDTTAEELERLAKRMQRSCGTGGTVKDGTIEIQGDKRDALAQILKDEGFKPVFAGG